MTMAATDLYCCVWHGTLREREYHDFSSIKQGC